MLVLLQEEEAETIGPEGQEAATFSLRSQRNQIPELSLNVTSQGNLGMRQPDSGEYKWETNQWQDQIDIHC